MNSETNTPDSPRADAPELAALIKAAGNEFVANDSLSEATYAAFATFGIAREVVEAHLAGFRVRLAVGRDITRMVYREAGGQEQYDSMRVWAQANLSADEIAEANATFEAGDFLGVLAQVKNLRTRYDAANTARAV